jgi:hypothetical protein
LCGKKFATIGNKNDHERRHNGTKPYSCTQCNVKYYRRYQLTKHKAKKHPSEPKEISDKNLKKRAPKKISKKKPKIVAAESSSSSSDSEEECLLLFDSSESISANKYIVD